MSAKPKIDVTVVLPAKYIQVMFVIPRKLVSDKRALEDRIEAVDGVHEATVDSDGGVEVLLDAKITTQRQAQPIIDAVLKELGVQSRGKVTFEQNKS